VQREIVATSKWGKVTANTGRISPQNRLAGKAPVLVCRPMKVTYDQLYDLLLKVQLKVGFAPARAQLSARLFAETSRDGVYSHGLNRFPRLMEQIKQGVVDVNAEPVRVGGMGGIERWDGRGGPGNLNAHACMDRAIALAREHGMGCVALANTNHWMRGGSYGWQAVEAGMIGMCWTNTMANLPSWGAPEPRIGNNPLIIAVPRSSGPVVLDMAMSQFSFGALEGYRMRGEQLPVEGGFDREGNLTRDPGAIEASGRALPIGYWKGSGLSLLLDMLGAVLSGGLATHQITVDVIQETRLSQVFLVFNLPALEDAAAGKPGVSAATRDRAIDAIVASVQGPDSPITKKLRYPGEKTLATRKQNLESGIPVDPKIWEKVQAMLG
jgi:3-dehydro-L-gulonate 2-dehydrogenase